MGECNPSRKDFRALWQNLCQLGQAIMFVIREPHQGAFWIPLLSFTPLSISPCSHLSERDSAKT
jgi:hypothetical protein